MYVFVMADSHCLQQKPIQHYKAVILHLNKNEYVLTGKGPLPMSGLVTLSLLCRISTG